MGKPRPAGKDNVKRPFAVLAVLALGLGAVAAWQFAPTSLPEDPLSALPSSASGAVFVDVPALRASYMWRELGQEPQEVLEGLTERCGFDPLGSLNHATIFAEGEERWSLDHVGIIARGEFDHAALGDCLEDVVSESGSPLIEMEMHGVPALAGRGDSRAAFVGSQGIVLGHEDAVDRTLGAVLGDAAPLSDDATLRSLYDRLAPGRELVFVGRIPPRWRDAAARAAGDAALLGSLEQVGIGARVSRGFAFGALLRFGDQAQAEQIVAHLRAQIDAALQRTLVSLSPLGPALRRVNLEAEDGEVNIAADYDDEQVARLFELAREFEAGWQSMRDEARPGLRDPRPRNSQPLQPDDVIRPGDQPGLGRPSRGPSPSER